MLLWWPANVVAAVSTPGVLTLPVAPAAVYAATAGEVDALGEGGNSGVSAGGAGLGRQQPLHRNDPRTDDDDGLRGSDPRHELATGMPGCVPGPFHCAGFRCLTACAPCRTDGSNRPNG